MTRASLVCLVALSSLLCVLVMRPAAARAEPSEPSELARQAFLRGIEASKSAHWLDARSEFKRSLELRAKPSAHYNLALADVMLGLGDEALAALDAFAQIGTGAEHAEMRERSKQLRSLAMVLRERASTPTPSASSLLVAPGLDAQGADQLSDAAEAYQAGDLNKALPLYEALYEQTHRPELLFDVALIADRLGARERAVLAYRAFAAALPDTNEAAIARARVLILGQPTARPPVAPMVEPTPLLAPPSLARAEPPVAIAVASRVVKGRELALALTVVGSTLAAGALGAGVWWIERAHERDRCTHPARAYLDCAREPQQAIERQYRAAIGTTLSLAIIALPLTIWGALKLARRDRTGPALPVAIDLGPRQLHVSAGMRF